MPQTSMFLRFLNLATVLTAFALTPACSRSPEEKKARFLEAGKQQMEKKEFARAILEFKNAVQAGPRDPEPYYHLALAYLETGDLRPGVALLRKTLELQPKHSAAQFKLAELMSLSGNTDVLTEAAERLEQIIQESPENVDAIHRLAVTEWKLGKREDAEQHLREAFRKSPANLNTSVSLALVHLGKGNQKEAEEVLKTAVAGAPSSAGLLVALGEFYAATGRAGEAAQQFNRALQIDGNNAKALMDTAALHVRSGQMDKAEQVYKRTSSLPEKRYRPVYAMFLMQTGRIPAGLAELERLAGETPGDREIRNLLLSAYLSRNKVEEAQNLLAATLKKNPKDADALMQRGRLHLSAGKLAEAEHDLTQALRFKNDSAIAHFLMAAVHKGRGAAQNQKQSLTQALRLTPGFLAARIELARAHMAARNPAAALDVLDEAPESQRLAAAAVVERNWALIALRRQNEARKNVAAALAAAKTAGLLFQDAVLKFDDRNYRASRAAVEELLKTDPENVRAVDLLVRTYFAERQPNAGLARLRELAERSQRPPLNMLLGQWLLATGKSSEARGVFSAVKAANPKSVAPDLALAQADLAERRFDSGRRTLQTVVSAEPGNVVARLLLARIEEQTGNNSAAVEQYRKIVETQPGNTPALNNLAFHLAAHSPDEALRYAQRAKDLAPEDPAVENTLGWTLYQKGLYSTAVRHLESAAAKQPTARRNAHLAMAYLKSGNRSRGQQALEAAVKLDPDLPEVKAAQDMVAADHRR